MPFVIKNLDGAQLGRDRVSVAVRDGMPLAEDGFPVLCPDNGIQPVLNRTGGNICDRKAAGLVFAHCLDLPLYIFVRERRRKLLVNLFPGFFHKTFASLPVLGIYKVGKRPAVWNQDIGFIIVQCFVFQVLQKLTHGTAWLVVCGIKPIVVVGQLQQETRQAV